MSEDRLKKLKGMSPEVIQTILLDEIAGRLEEASENKGQDNTGSQSNGDEETLADFNILGIQRLEEKVSRDLKERAIGQKIARTHGELVVRDILPETDLYAVSGEIWWQNVSGNLWNMWYSGRLPNNKLLAFYGYGSTATNPATAAVRFREGTVKVKNIWQVQHSYTNSENSKIYCRQPIFYNANESFGIDFYGITGALDWCVLFGKACEPVGANIMGEKDVLWEMRPNRNGMVVSENHDYG